jgi:hypothetical protein
MGVIMPFVNVRLKKMESLCFILFFFFLASNASTVKYLHFFDAMDNRLMFIEFEYDANGINTAQSVFMSDSTFVKRTIFKNASDGKKDLEISFNFNEDTLFSTSLRSDAGKSFIKVKDQFGVDQFGSEVSYTESTTDNFDFFQNNSQINKMSYEKDGNGIYRKISVYDNAQKLIYYATIQYDGDVTAVKSQQYPLILPSIHATGNNRFEFHFTILKPSLISCELTSLSGRHVGKLFNNKYATGAFNEVISLTKSMPNIANGVYLMSLSINGRSVSSEKILVQRTKGGL